MQAQEISVLLTKYAEQMTAKRWADFIRQLEQKGLYMVIETDTNGRMMSPLGGLMPIPCKNETFHICTVEELEQRGLAVGHHILVKARNKTEAANG
ncbi:hypothetical protein [Brevibacillus fulvus]|uniref:Uncharacterized protein n=1 Tax=Brevibacillus fulvus TaxID=1125967 RepID=A0A938XXF6_9BACL|nr:hypothetical protein [Brevibacillus fulvus]MBM7589423.1 hypothetical protein [Brevibacillus fulvus]